MSRPRISGDTVVKFHGKTLLSDWTRVERLFEVSRQVHGLEAAEPISINRTNETITYRRVHRLTPYLPHVLADPERARTAGRLLAELHRVDTESTKTTRQAANGWLRKLGVLHEDIKEISRLSNPGLVLTDCWHGNIFWKPDGTLVVLDPLPVLPNLRLTPFYAYGLVDVAMLHMSHFFYHGVARSFFSSPQRQYAKPARELIASYSQETSFDLDLLTRVSSLIAKSHIRHYRHRLCRPVATVKAHVANSIFNSLYGFPNDDHTPFLQELA